MPSIRRVHVFFLLIATTVTHAAQRGPYARPSTGFAKSTFGFAVNSTQRAERSARRTKRQGQKMPPPKGRQPIGMAWNPDAGRYDPIKDRAAAAAPPAAAPPSAAAYPTFIYGSSMAALEDHLRAISGVALGILGLPLPDATVMTKSMGTPFGWTAM